MDNVDTNLLKHLESCLKGDIMMCQSIIYRCKSSIIKDSNILKKLNKEETKTEICNKFEMYHVQINNSLNAFKAKKVTVQEYSKYHTLDKNFRHEYAKFLAVLKTL